MMKNLMNYILYGNTKGMPTNMGKTTNEYDDFIKKVYRKDKINAEIDAGKCRCREITGRDYEILDEELQ